MTDRELIEWALGARIFVDGKSYIGLVIGTDGVERVFTPIGFEHHGLDQEKIQSIIEEKARPLITEGRLR